MDRDNTRPGSLRDSGLGKRLLHGVPALGLVLVGILILGYVLRDLALVPLLRRAITRTAESSLGMEIEIGSIRGTLLSTVDVCDVRTRRPGAATPVTRIDVAHLAASYSLIDLLAGRPWLHDVRIEGGRVGIDLTRSPPRPPEEAPPEAPAPPPWLPDVSLHQVALDLIAPDLTVTVPAIDGRVRQTSPDGASLVTFRLGGMQIATAARRRAVDLQGRLHYRAGLITIDRIDLDQRRVVLGGRLDARDLARRIVSFDVTTELAGGLLHASGSLEGDRLRGQCVVEDLDLERLGALAELTAPQASGTLDLEAHIEGPVSDLAASRARLSLELRDGAVNSMPIERLTLRSRLAGKTLSIPTLTLRSGRLNRIRIHEARVPLETDLNTLLMQADGIVSVDLTDLPALLGPFGISPLDGDAPPHHLLFEARAAESGLQVLTGRFETEGATLTLDGARLAAAPDPTDWRAATADADLEIALEDLEAIGKLFGLADLTGRLQGTLGVHGPLGSPRAGMDLTGDAVVLGARQLGHVRIEVRGTPSRLTLRTCRLRGLRHDIRLHGTLDVGSMQLEDAGLTAALDSIAEVLGPAPGLQGKAVVRATAHGPLVLPQLDLAVDAQDLALNGTELGDLVLHAVNDQHRLLLSTLRLDGPLTLSVGGRIDHDLEAGSHSIAFDQIGLTSRGGTIDLHGGGRIEIGTGGSLRADSLHLAGTGGELTVHGGVRPDADIDLRIEARGLAPEELLTWWAPDGPRLDELTELTVIVEGPETAPVIRLRGAARGLRVAQGPPADLTLDLDHQERRTSIKDARLRIEGHEVLVMTGEVALDPFGATPLAPGPLDAHLRLEADELAPLLEGLTGVRVEAGRLQGSVDVSGTWKRPRLETAIQARGLRVAAKNIPIPPGAVDLDASATYAEGQFRIEDLSVQVPRYLTMSARGGASLHLDLSALGSGQHLVEPGPLDTTVHFDLPDLTWLVQTADPLRDAAGHLAGDLHLGGTTDAPVLTGHADLGNAMLRLADPSLGRIEALGGRLVLEQSTLRLESLRGDLGAAPFQASGTVTIADPRAPVLDLRLLGQDILLFRRRGIKVRANTDITVRGPLTGLQVTGAIDVTDGCFVRNVDLLGFTRRGSTRPSGPKGIDLFSFSEAPLAQMSFDVTVRCVHPFRVENNIIKGGVRPDLRLTGTGEVPRLLGTVYVDPTKVSMPSGVLRAPSGVVRFEEPDPFTPQLDIPLEARLSGYDVQLLVTGTLDEPEVRLSSSPPLPQDDLLVLVTTGQAPRKGSTRTGRAAMGAVALYLGQDILVRLLGSESTEIDETLLDRFEMETGRDVSESGTETIEARFRIFDNLLTGDDSLYLQTERDEYEDFNMGFKLVFRFK